MPADAARYRNHTPLTEAEVRAATEANGRYRVRTATDEVLHAWRGGLVWLMALHDAGELGGDPADTAVLILPELAAIEAELAWRDRQGLHRPPTRPATRPTPSPRSSAGSTWSPSSIIGASRCDGRGSTGAADAPGTRAGAG